MQVEGSSAVQAVHRSERGDAWKNWALCTITVPHRKEMCL